MIPTEPLRLGRIAPVHVPDNGFQLHSTVFGGLRDAVSCPDTVRDLAAVGALTAELTSVHPDDQAERVLDWTREVLNVEASEIFLREPGGQDMLLSYFRGDCESAFSEMDRFHIGRGYPGLVLSNGESIRTTDLRGDDRFLRERVKAEGFRSYICTPLRGSDGIIGALNVASRRTDMDIERAARILNWAGAFVSSLLEATSLRAQLAAMTPIAEMSVDCGLEDLSLTLLGQMMEVSGANFGELTLFRPALRGTLHRVTSGGDCAPLCNTVRSEDSLPCPALTGNRGITLTGTRGNWPERCRHLTAGADVVHCLPLVAEGEPVGMVQLRYESGGPRPATKHVAVLHEVATHTAGILMRARDADLRRVPAGEPVTEAKPGARRRTLRFDVDPSAVIAREQSCVEDPVTPELDIRCFGSFGLIKAGHQILPGSVQRRGAITLLKMLVVNDGHAVTRDVMAEAIWPDANPDVVANRIHVLIHALRRAIESPGPGRRKNWTFIRNDGDRYYLNPDAPYRSDVQDFCRLAASGNVYEARGRMLEAANSYEAALGLYVGDLFEDEPYAEWCWVQREHLRETALNVAVKLAAQHARRRELDKSISVYRRALRIDSLREEIHRGLIAALLAADRRDEAMRQYAVCSESLQKELGVSPLPETRRLLFAVSQDLA